MALQSTLRVLSNFGDGDSVVGEIHTRARNLKETRALLNFATIAKIR